MSQPIRIHPENPKLFEFRDQPLILITATEHYGAVLNRPFPIERYITDIAECGINYTRLFMLFRELQTAANPYSTCKPESPDFVTPFERVGPDSALDYQPKYDLDRWNPEFFERLHRFLAAACDHGVIVEVVLFSNTYDPPIWALNPLNAHNNINDVETIEWYDYNTLRNARILAYQEAHTRRVVEEVNRFDNVIIEICNEPGGGLGISGSPEPEIVNEWLNHMIRLVRETEAKLPNQHLVVGEEAFAYKLPEEEHNPLDVHQFVETAFREMDYDAVNTHPLSSMNYEGKRYDMGGFMRGKLHLRPLRDFCLETYGEAKPLNLDEDNTASQDRTHHGWTIHRKRAWTTVFCGAHYDMIDFSIIVHCDQIGTEDSRRYLRACMGYLVRFVHTLDLARSKPLLDVVVEQPFHTCVAVFGVPDSDFAVYVADERETEDPDCGETIRGDLQLRVAAGNYLVSCFEPETGLSSPTIAIASDGQMRFPLPEFERDITVRLSRVDSE